MNIIPPVRAVLAERYIFNFRLPVEVLAAYLPMPWLAPQKVNGFGVASFCLLDLRHITIAPLPTVIGLRSTSCAPRYAVLDLSRGKPTPAVFVTERQTSSAFGAWFTSLGFSCHHPYAPAGIDRHGPEIALRVQRPDNDFRFAATVSPTQKTHSMLFGSPSDFGAFIAQGVTSYGLCRYPNQLTRVDLHKEDFGYEPLDVHSLSCPLLEEWERQGGILDSAFRTQGGRYEWTYYGLREVNAS
jgi:hypothetical protein